jgi:hypothetical protein
MRTTAEADSPAAGRARASRARQARRAVPHAEAAPSEAAPSEAGPQPATPEPPSVAVTTTRMLRVDEGLYVLRVGALGGSPGQVAGMALPVAHVSVPFAEDGNAVEIVAAFPRRGPWLRRDGGTLILRSPSGGGYVIVSVYGPAGQQAGELALDLRRLDGAPAADGAAAPLAATAAIAGEPASPTGRTDVPSEILLHIERAGDRVFPGRGWVGALGRRMRIEAFSIRPTERLAPADIEMKGFLPNGGETPWVPGGGLCGTRGRGLPLIGFAMRIAPQRADRFEVLYQGSFFAGGISETRRNGDPCRSASGDDPLEAVNVRIVEHAAEADPAETAA